MDLNNESLGSQVFNNMKLANTPPFDKEEYNILISHFRNQELTQFYFKIIQKTIDSGKNFPLPEEELKTKFVAYIEYMLESLAKKVGWLPDNDDEIISRINEIYKILFVIDTVTMYNRHVLLNYNEF